MSQSKFTARLLLTMENNDNIDADTQKEETITAAVLEKRLNVVDHDFGFAVRYCEGPRPFLKWQAGLLLSEKRNIKGRWVNQPVFRLMGYGDSQDAAVDMARRNEMENGK